MLFNCVKTKLRGYYILINFIIPNKFPKKDHLLLERSFNVYNKGQRCHFTVAIHNTIKLIISVKKD